MLYHVVAFQTTGLNWRYHSWRTALTPVVGVRRCVGDGRRSGAWTLRGCAARPTGGDSLRWRDTVALYAQLSAEQTVEHLLEGLSRRQGPSTAYECDEGIEALYAFANFDVWSIQNEFFGKRIDLGQFERFKRIMVAKPYSALLRHKSRCMLSSVRVSSDLYHCRVQVLSSTDEAAVFRFCLSRRVLPGAPRASRRPRLYWMVDQILYEQVSER
ncbi:hypothetical protein CCYA_CCYA17G4432 [Cyanidiococcus yangmingshanensis]|nr:hypothetical protein CCYA_CCYA17G4432 [Cyanidiococcus yangmingshanensis]